MIYVIFGPTGSGKTSASLELSKRLNAPIVNADAFQIYKEMDIGTAKIEKNHPLYDRHHLLDVVSPDMSFSVKEYQDLFRKKIDELSKDNKDIIVVGGTGLYIKASLYDYTFSNEEETSYDDLENLTNEELKAKLDELDKQASLLIHVNNRKRLLRALVMIRNQNEKKSDIIAKQEHRIIYKDVKCLFLNPNREDLYNNINKRVDLMFENGLIDEVTNLINKYSLSITSFQGIGYKEVISYLNKEISLEECKELIKKRTRNYAKRQITFFKNQFEYEEFDNVDDLVNSLSY